MPKYLATSMYNQQAAGGVLEQGFAARTEQFREGVEALGGTLEGYWWSGTGQIVVLMDFPEPQNFALAGLQVMASGSVTMLPEITQLYDGGEMDAAVASQGNTYVAPGRT